MNQNHTPTTAVIHDRLINRPQHQIEKKPVINAARISISNGNRWLWLEYLHAYVWARSRIVMRIYDINPIMWGNNFHLRKANGSVWNAICLATWMVWFCIFMMWRFGFAYDSNCTRIHDNCWLLLTLRIVDRLVIRHRKNRMHTNQQIVGRWLLLAIVAFEQT